MKGDTVIEYESWPANSGPADPASPLRQPSAQHMRAGTVRTDQWARGTWIGGLWRRVWE